jgi:hypothetical protein
MAQILNPKVKATGLWDAIELGIFKSVAEKTLQPVIGNSTVVSGGAKLIAGGVLSGVSRNKHVGLLSSALVVDGIEDGVHALLAPMLNKDTKDSGGNF